jgi:hypothetical protein
MCLQQASASHTRSQDAAVLSNVFHDGRTAARERSSAQTDYLKAAGPTVLVSVLQSVRAESWLINHCASAVLKEHGEEFQPCMIGDLIRLGKP